MSKPETVTIDDVKYIRADSVSVPVPPGDVKIVVLDRGFVYVGRVEIVGDFVNIWNAQNIRVWGTKAGLGELVNGPLRETKLDKVGSVKAPMRAVIHMIDVDGTKWKGT